MFSTFGKLLIIKNQYIPKFINNVTLCSICSVALRQVLSCGTLCSASLFTLPINAVMVKIQPNRTTLQEARTS
ncbi:exported hypothetical protein [Vibrio harveyi]|nr:exported hypothetical protein [Vibrio harveyi]